VPFLRATVVLSLAVLLGRIAGFLREAVLAARAGATVEADAAVVLLTLPDFLVALLLAGGFGAALVPAFRGLPPDRRRHLLRQALVLVLAGFGILSAAIALWPRLVFAALAPAMAPDDVLPWLPAVRLVAAALPLAALSGVLGAWLQAGERFGAGGTGTLVYNGVLVAALALYFDPSQAPAVISWGVAAALLARLAFLLAMTRGMPMLPAGTGVPEGLPLRFVAGVAATGLTALSPVLFRTLASLEAGGQLASFSYGIRLFDFVAGVLVGPIATVALTRFSGLTDGVRPAFDRLAATMAVISVAAMATGAIHAEALVRLAYDRGAMTGDGIAAVVHFMRLMMLALPFMGLAMLAAAALYARSRPGVVLGNALVALACGVGVALAGPALVLPGFIAFHAVNAALNLAALRPGTGALRHLARPVPLALSLAALLGGLAVASWVPAMAASLPGTVVAVLSGAAMLAAWAPLLRPLLRRAG
jgi:peptidoglycan biosynthesis protein MviN/MurJ (putative lipid II flippase)